MKPSFLIFAVLFSFCAFAKDDLSKEETETLGGYPYFAALDKRCGDPSQARTDSLAEYKKLALLSVKTLLDSSSKDNQLDAKQREQIEKSKKEFVRMEKNWPTEEDMKVANRIFDRLNTAEINELCKTFPQDVDQRMQLVKLLLDSSIQMNKLREQQQKQQK